MSENVIETRVCRTWLGEDGILRTVMAPGCRVDLEAAQEIWQAQQGLLGTRQYVSFVDIRGIGHATRDARELLGGQAQERLPVAMALVVGSAASKVIGSFFLGLNRPAFPTKLFTSESVAIDWLMGFAPPPASRQA